MTYNEISNNDDTARIRRENVVYFRHKMEIKKKKKEKMNIASNGTLESITIARIIK